MSESLGDPAALTSRPDAGNDIDVEELVRLRAVRRYEVLDTPSDETFDRITALTARLLQVPIGLISIVDSDRVWFMSHHGLDTREVPRDATPSPTLFLHPEPWIVNDARLDPRTSSNALVTGDLKLRFYAAAPLMTNDGYNLGALCAIDEQPHQISPMNLAVLQDLAALVMHEMELRLEIRCALKMDDTLLQRSRVEKRHAEYLAKHDALTGLGNRRKLNENFTVEINRLRRHGGSLCVLIADIDHFKKINDSHGHAMGDEVLARLGELLCQQMRPTDTAARIGGEEFVVLMPHTKVREALATAERFRAAMVKAAFGSLKESVTVSIGVAELQDDEDGDALLRRADHALYAAKRAGRNQVVAAESGEIGIAPETG
ncbi:MAG: sensor domain-containing diguanylate cyclase [Betaproteobacteria bacterium]